MAVVAQSMNKLVSPYYPPRARWYGPLFHWRDTLRRHLALDRILLPKGITVRGFAASVLVPGLGVYLRGPRLWGKLALATCGFLFLQFIVWLGYPFGNYAFGLMLSIHVTGLTYYCTPLLVEMRFRYRLLFTVGLLMALSGFIYAPMRSALQNHWLIPLRNGGQVIIVSVQRPGSLRRGDWAAFNTKDGVLFGRIAGLGGDQIDSLTVPENHWLVHAQFARRYYHEGLFPTDTGRAEIFEQSVVVSPEEFIGKPFDRWFWRKRNLQ